MAELETKSTSIAAKIVQAVTNSFRISSRNKRLMNLFREKPENLKAEIFTLRAILMT